MIHVACFDLLALSCCLQCVPHIRSVELTNPSNLRLSLLSLASNPNSRWTVAANETAEPQPIDDIEIVTPSGLISLGVPFMYTIADDWNCYAAPCAHVFPRTVENPRGVPRLRIISDDNPDRFGTRINVLYRTLIGDRVLLAREYEHRHTPISVLRLYHSAFRYLTVSASSLSVPDDLLTPMVADPWPLVDIDGFTLRGVLLRWVCDQDPAAISAKHGAQYIDHAHRMIPVSSMSIGHEDESERDRFKAPLRAWTSHIPHMHEYVLDAFYQEAKRDTTGTLRVMRELVSRLSEFSANQRGVNKPGRPPKRLVDKHASVVPWKLAPRKY